MMKNLTPKERATTILRDHYDPVLLERWQRRRRYYRAWLRESEAKAKTKAKAKAKAKVPN